MNKAIAWVAVVGIVALVAGVAMADREGGGGGPAAPSPLTAKGEITKVDGATVSVKLTDLTLVPKDGKDIIKAFVTDDKTTVTLDDKAVKVSDLKEGQTVTVTYAMEKGKDGLTYKASKIEAKSAK